MELLQCNCSSLRGATRALTLAYDEALRPSGLRMTQFSILARVAAVGPMRVNELAELLVMDRTTLGRNIQPLEREGFVALEVGSDRRERLINLTPAGRRVLSRAMVLWKEVHQRFESKFDVLEAKALRETMKLIIKIGRELSSENATEA